MKVEISDATGTQLDWLVAKCWYSDEYDKERVFLYHSGFKWAKHIVRIANQDTCTRDLSFEWEPTTNWAQGGPIIERERITVGVYHDEDGNVMLGHCQAYIGWKKTSLTPCSKQMAQTC